MSHSSYTASERRGIILIAIVSLLILCAGVILSVCGRQTNLEEGEVIELPQMIDSVRIKETETIMKKKDGRKASRSNKTKSEKTYRRRSPLDEPV